MNLDPAEPTPEFPTEDDVNAVLYEHKGNAREAIRALLHDLAVLAADYGTDVSCGYVRGVVPRLTLKRPG